MSQYKAKSDQRQSEYEEKVVQISRVSKKTKGGNQISFSALMVVGDKNGRVGVALGKAPDVLSAIKKGIRKAKKELIRVPILKGTIPFPLEVKYGAANVLLKPAPSGSGIIAGGSVRSVVEAAGITDIVGKILGSSNKASNVYATFEALKQIKALVKVKEIDLEDNKDNKPTTKASPKSEKSKKSPKKVNQKPVSKKTNQKSSQKNKKSSNSTNKNTKK